MSVLGPGITHVLGPLICLQAREGDKKNNISLKFHSNFKMKLSLLYEGQTLGYVSCGMHVSVWEGQSLL